MNIGPLSTRCRIEYRVATQDATYGTETVTWALLGAAWCNLQDVLPSRSEGAAQGLESSKNATRWRTNYRTDVDSSMRIIVNRPTPQTFQIISGPAILGDKQGIECMIEKVSTEN